ncbi:TauD/TfdA family dioxygenase, partial [Micromonospora sp. DH15]|nr:TauD/TfdA family dioxygenase [Micromonospora sp. DH15]
MSGPGPRRRGAAPAAAPVTRRVLVDDSFVLLVEAAVADLDLAGWLAGRRDELLRDLDAHGAVLFRGFEVATADDFSRAARAVTPDLLGYLERAAPRTEVADRVFTSTEFNAEQWIPLHHEMSYSHNWPTHLYFWCAQPATGSGGATPLASERVVTPRIPAQVRERFTRDGVCYVRNYGPHLDLPWQEAFQTTDRAEVEAYCAASATEFTWLGGDGLRTRARRQAVATHPRTGETFWFNHAHLFHSSNMPAEVS